MRKAKGTAILISSLLTILLMRYFCNLLKFTEKSRRAHYLVPIACKTLDILEEFRTPHERLTLRRFIERTSIVHTTAFRLLKQLVHRSYVSV